MDWPSKEVVKKDLKYFNIFNINVIRSAVCESHGLDPRHRAIANEENDCYVTLCLRNKWS